MSEKEWVVRETDEGFSDSLARELQLSPLTARLLFHRGIRSSDDAERFMNTSLHHMRSPFLFRHMEGAVQRIHQAIVRKEKVLIYGDYDADGLTSTAILVHFLRSAGLDPLHHIPDRINEGYGFHASAIPAFLDQGVQLIITVDCGVSDQETVNLAKKGGIDVIITDHHECSDELPPDLLVLNPKVEQSGFPFRDLAGVGVAFYLVVALRTRLREKGVWDEDSQPNLREYLDLVALGTLADMMPLQHENRIFVRFGMQEISSSSRPGVTSLKEQAGLDGDVRATRPLLFRVIPRINAPGRLGRAQESLDLLLCSDPVEAGEITKALELCNRERKAVEGEVFREALRQAEKQLSQRDGSVLVLAGDGWHRGILGIVASRLAREHQRPVVLLSFDGDFGKGSVRSVEGLEILDALRTCSPFLEGFGGHRMAAGLSMKKESLPEFTEAFDRAVGEGIGRVQPRLLLDLWVDDPRDLKMEVVEEFEQLGPFGPGNPEPVVGMRNVKLLEKRIVGGNHLKCTVSHRSVEFDAIGFGMGDLGIVESLHPCWDIVFTPRHEYWKGRYKTSLSLLDMRPSSDNRD